MQASRRELLRIPRMKQCEAHEHLRSISTEGSKLHDTLFELLLLNHQRRKRAVQSHVREITGQLPVYEESQFSGQQASL
jgi:hypothetical protein